MHFHENILENVFCKYRPFCSGLSGIEFQPTNQIHIMIWLNHNSSKDVCVLITVTTDALVLKYQTINIHSAD